MTSATISNPAAMAQTILLHPNDNVLVCVADIQPGDQLLIDDQPVLAPQAIGVGHKLARRALQAGEKILKYGAPVGSMTAPADCGAHVHMHNMQSDYLPSHTRARQSPNPEARVNNDRSQT